jgi:hypothetical protein
MLDVEGRSVTEEVTCVAWSDAGSMALLAVATRCSIAVFTLHRQETQLEQPISKCTWNVCVTVMMACRFFQRMTGDLVGSASDDAAPAAQQLCIVSSQAAAVALDWTQKADGLLVADASGGVTMYYVACQLSSHPLASTQSGVITVLQTSEQLAGMARLCELENRLHAGMQGCGTCEASRQAPQEQA